MARYNPGFLRVVLGFRLGRLLYWLLGENPATRWLTCGGPMRPVGDMLRRDFRRRNGFYLDQYGRLWYTGHRWDWHRYRVRDPPEYVDVQRVVP